MRFAQSPDQIPAALAPAAAARRAWLRAAAGAGLAALLAGRSGPAQAKGLEVGKPAPPLVLHTLDGRTIGTRELLGEVVILAFWASWCEPCCRELPLLSDYARQHSGEGLQVLGFSLDDAEDLPAVHRLADPLSFPVGLLGSSYAADYGRIWTLPVSFVIDRAGRLAYDGWRDTKATAWTRERLQAVVDPLLAART